MTTTREPTAAEILDEIAVVLEEHGYAHMANADGIRSILRAAASERAKAAPVGWQWRFRTIGREIGQWTDWSDGRAPTLLASSYEVEERPTFAAPPDMRQAVEAEATNR